MGSSNCVGYFLLPFIRYNLLYSLTENFVLTRSAFLSQCTAKYYLLKKWLKTNRKMVNKKNELNQVGVPGSWTSNLVWRGMRGCVKTGYKLHRRLAKVGSSLRHPLGPFVKLQAPRAKITRVGLPSRLGYTDHIHTHTHIRSLYHTVFSKGEKREASFLVGAGFSILIRVFKI